jgi:hypothetical protein
MILGLDVTDFFMAFQFFSGSFAHWSNYSLKFLKILFHLSTMFKLRFKGFQTTYFRIQWWYYYFNDSSYNLLNECRSKFN